MKNNCKENMPVFSSKKSRKIETVERQKCSGPPFSFPFFFKKSSEAEP